MTHGSLFSGIGGFDLAAQWMGWNNVFHVERDPFCRQVLTHHFPQSQSFDDVKTFDATPFRGRVSIISGGFPCQPFSAAGKRAGTSDDRYLWPEMFRIIREARPTYVVAENVRGLLSWNDGLVLDTVCSDLEGEGYEVCPVVLPAASVNAPHRRDRIWIVAYAHDKGGAGGLRQVQGANGEVSQWDNDAQPCNAGAADATNAECERPQGRGDWRNNIPEEAQHGQTEICGDNGNVTNANGQECERGGSTSEREREASEQGRNGIQRTTSRLGKKSDVANANQNGLQGGLPAHKHKETPGAGAYAAQRLPIQPGGLQFENFPTFAPICGGDDGLPSRLDGITIPKWRRESIKAYGNAIVPQVALQIFRALEEVQSN